MYMYILKIENYLCQFICDLRVIIDDGNFKLYNQLEDNMLRVGIISI